MPEKLRPAIVFVLNTKRLSIISRNLIELMQEEKDISDSELLDFMDYEIGISKDELSMIYEESER